METEQNGSPEPDLEAAVSAADPADKAASIQENLEERARSDDPTEKRQAMKQIDLQGALREGFSYINMIGKQVAPPFEHAEEELDNLAVLWSEVLKDVEREKIMRFIEKMPLVAAGAYTVVTTGPKVRDSVQYLQEQNAELESTDSEKS